MVLLANLLYRGGRLGVWHRRWLSRLSVVSVLPVITFYCILNLGRESGKRLSFLRWELQDVIKGEWQPRVGLTIIFVG